MTKEKSPEYFVGLCVALIVGCGLLTFYPWWVLVPAWLLIGAYAGKRLCVGEHKNVAAMAAVVAGVGTMFLWRDPLWLLVSQPSLDHLFAFLWNKGTLLVVVAYSVTLCVYLRGEVDSWVRADERSRTGDRLFGVPDQKDR